MRSSEALRNPGAVPDIGDHEHEAWEAELRHQNAGINAAIDSALDAEGALDKVRTHGGGAMAAHLAELGLSEPPMVSGLTRRAGALSPELAVGLIIAALGGPVDEPTRHLLVTAGRGDPAFTIALVAAGRALGNLAPAADGMWIWRDAAWLTAAFTAGEITALDLFTIPRQAGNQPIHLTPRESDVLELLQEGLTARAIARQLDLSTRTVSKYQERLYRKLGTSDRLTTVLRAHRLGLLVRRPTDGDAQGR